MKKVYKNTKVLLFPLLLLSLLVSLFIACYEPDFPPMKRQLTIEVEGDGEVDFNDEGVILPGSTFEVIQGQNINIKAILSENGGEFQRWELDEGSDAYISDIEAPVTTIRLNEDNAVLTAYFITREFTLSLSADDCGTVDPSEVVSVPRNEPIAISATPAGAQCVFSYWDILSGTGVDFDNQYSAVTIVRLTKEDASVKAVFTEIDTEYTLTLTASPTGSGTFTKVPDQPTYHYGDEVIITAKGEEPCRAFDFWSSGANGKTNPLPVTITGDTSITGNFNLRQYTITATASPYGAISDPGSVLIYCGDTQTYNFDADNNCILVDVIVNGFHLNPLPSSYTFFGVKANHSITAIFMPVGGYTVSYAQSDDSDAVCECEVFSGSTKATYEEVIDISVTHSTCTFWGWYPIPDGNVSIPHRWSSSTSVTILGDVTFYAHMEW